MSFYDEVAGTPCNFVGNSFIIVENKAVLTLFLINNKVILRLKCAIGTFLPQKLTAKFDD